MFTTCENNQTVISIYIFGRGNSLTKDNYFFGKFDLNGIPPAPRGITQIEVIFHINQQEILTVSATEKSTGKSKKICIDIRNEMKIKQNIIENYNYIYRMLYINDYIFSFKNFIDDKIKSLEKKTDKEKENIINIFNEAKESLNNNQTKQNSDFILDNIYNKEENPIQELKLCWALRNDY